MEINLIDQNCIEQPQAINSSEIENYLTQIGDWSLVEDKKLQKDFTFEDFNSVLKFVNKLGKLAEEQQHHPDIFIHSYKKLQVTFSTHLVGGLSINDFIMAVKVNNIK